MLIGTESYPPNLRNAFHLLISFMLPSTCLAYCRSYSLLATVLLSTDSFNCFIEPSRT